MKVKSPEPSLECKRKGSHWAVSGPRKTGMGREMGVSPPHTACGSYFNISSHLESPASHL